MKEQESTKVDLTFAMVKFLFQNIKQIDPIQKSKLKNPNIDEPKNPNKQESSSTYP